MTFLDYNARIVEPGYFDWGEYALLQEWQTLAIPTKEEQQNAILLFEHLHPLRVELNQSLIIRSGARTSHYTQFLRQRGIPAALKSAHNDWQAVDLASPQGMSIEQFWRWCDKRWAGRMEVVSATPTWVHLDIRQWGQGIRFKP